MHTSSIKLFLKHRKRCARFMAVQALYAWEKVAPSFIPSQISPSSILAFLKDFWSYWHQDPDFQDLYKAGEMKTFLSLAQQAIVHHEALDAFVTPLLTRRDSTMGTLTPLTRAILRVFFPEAKEHMHSSAMKPSMLTFEYTSIAHFLVDEENAKFIHALLDKAMHVLSQENKTQSL